MDKVYLDQIPELDSIVFEALSGYLREPEAIESRSRSGFSAASYNHGGYEAIGFIGAFDALQTNSKKGVKDANRILKDCDKEAKEAYEASDKSKDFESFRDDFESEWLYDGQCDQMLSIRFMYHGQNNLDDYHSATLDVAINWEAPYFRFNKGMSDVREITLEWKTPNELKSLLDTKLPELIELFGGMERESY